MSQTTNEFQQPVGRPLAGWHAPSGPGKEVLEGRTCRLEPLDPERHAEALFAANRHESDGRAWTYLPYGPFATFDAYLEWVQRVASGSDPLFFAIVDLSRGGPTGVASYLRIQPEIGSIEVGHLHFSPLLQGTVAATEAMFLMMSRAFELGYRRYEWKCDALNAPSRLAARRLGFTFEGVFRQATVVKGRNRDTAWYAVIDRDWPALDAAFREWLRSENFDKQGRQRSRLSDLTARVLERVGLEQPVTHRDGPLWEKA